MPCNLSLFIQYNHIVELDSFCFVSVFSCFYIIPCSLSLFIQYDNTVELDAFYTTIPQKLVSFYRQQQYCATGQFLQNTTIVWNGTVFLQYNNTVEMDTFNTIPFFYILQKIHTGFTQYNNSVESDSFYTIHQYRGIGYI